MTGHGCSAYCRDGVHCELVYTSPLSIAGAQLHLRAAYRRQYGVTITRVEVAREAPPLARQAAHRLVSLAGTPQDSARWLVWWQEAAG